MILYLTRRVLYFIPTLVIISLAAFLISILAPGNPAERLLNTSSTDGSSHITNRAFAIKQKKHELGLDLPFFYFSLGTLADANTKQNINGETWKNYVPAIHFYGEENQYHRWISAVILHGDFGKSYQTQLPVLREIKSRLPWSLVLSFFSVIIAFGVSIPIGLYAAKYKERFFDKASVIGLFVLYAFPNFVVASMLLVFFANPQFLNWFPDSGVQDVLNTDPNRPFFLTLLHSMPYLVLPLISYTYSSIAFLSRQMRSGAIDIFSQEYIKTARAKGLSEFKILWKHVFRNALMPIITIFAHVFPAALVGSVIVETIFAIPGMGREIYEAILNYDYPVIVAVFTIFGFLTLTGYLISDILYAIADPRITYSKS